MYLRMIQIRSTKCIESSIEEVRFGGLWLVFKETENSGGWQKQILRNYKNILISLHVITRKGISGVVAHFPFFSDFLVYFTILAF